MNESQEIDIWESLLEPSSTGLLEAAAGADPREAKDLLRLRKHWSRDQVSAALQLVRARQKAREKFPSLPDIVGDVAGVEQATSELAARHKARRFERLGASEVIDICCGIGGDAMALSRHAAVTGIDADPLRLWMAGANVHSWARRAGDPPPGWTGVHANLPPSPCDVEVFHLDPGRRGDTRARSASSQRARSVRDYSPPPSVWREIVARSSAGAIKIAPGIDRRELEATLDGPKPGELEFISEHGRLTQAVLWCGELARPASARTATRLPGGESISGAAVEPAPSSQGEVLDLVLVFDPALERAGLHPIVARELELRELWPGLGIFTARHCPASPWTERHEVVADLGWRVADVRRWLKAHDAATPQLRTRGRAIDVAAARKQLRLQGSRRFVIFALRLGRKLRAIVTERAAPDSD